MGVAPMVLPAVVDAGLLFALFFDDGSVDDDDDADEDRGCFDLDCESDPASCLSSSLSLSR